MPYTCVDDIICLDEEQSPAAEHHKDWSDVVRVQSSHVPGPCRTTPHWCW